LTGCETFVPVRHAVHFTEKILEAPLVPFVGAGFIYGANAAVFFSGIASQYIECPEHGTSRGKR
jgi:hypothetical protein